MSQFLSLRGLSILLATLLFLLLFSSTHAGGIHVSPYSGDYDTEFSVMADGFYSHEPVDTWVGKPNQWRVGRGQVTADAHGSIEFSFSPDVTWGTGGFVAIARGLHSDIELQAPFHIGGGGNPLAPCCGKPVLLGNPGGLAVNYNAAGYGPNETVSVNMQDPSAQIRRLPNAQADAWGNLVFVLAFTPDSLYGPYLITATGFDTGRFTYNTLTLWGGIFDHRSSAPITTATPSYVLRGAGFTPQENSAPPVPQTVGTPEAAAKPGNVGFSRNRLRGE